MIMIETEINKVNSAKQKEIAAWDKIASKMNQNYSSKY